MAGKFRFRLQPVLEQRERIEQARQLHVAELERERLVVEEVLRACQRDIQAAKVDLRDRLAGTATAGVTNGLGMDRGMVVIPEVRAQASASIHLEAKARLAAMELAGAYKRLERARQELLQAATAKKAVELLKERRFQEWKDERNRFEALATDEAATQQFIRLRRESESGDA